MMKNLKSFQLNVVGQDFSFLYRENEIMKVIDYLKSKGYVVNESSYNHIVNSTPSFSMGNNSMNPTVRIKDVTNKSSDLEMATPDKVRSIFNELSKLYNLEGDKIRLRLFFDKDGGFATIKGGVGPYWAKIFNQHLFISEIWIKIEIGVDDISNLKENLVLRIEEGLKIINS